MTSIEVMQKLYPGMPMYQISVNAAWLDAQAQLVTDGGVIGSPRDLWVVRKVREGDYEILLPRQ